MILVIGATGNIGKHVVTHLQKEKAPFIKGVYEPKIVLPDEVPFDFLNAKTFGKALNGVTKVFFVRPPQLGNPKDIYPFLDYCKETKIKHVVFISLMGVEKNPIPPHAKIEKYIKKIELPYSFVRPSFFMENLIYPHGDDIVKTGQIIVPANHSKTSFIAAKDIGEVAATLLINTDQHINKAYTITGPKALDYNEVAAIFTEILNKPVVYTKPSMKVYEKHMLDQGFDKDYVKITKLLYFMTRLGTAKKVNTVVADILNRKATTFAEFIQDNLDYYNK